jgi:hypothetical protein
MRDAQVNVFYYPDFEPDGVTLKKAILLFDEIHLMDRPSFSFLPADCGTVGMRSPLRIWEEKFRSEGVRLFVHGAPRGPMSGELYQRVIADINDLEFLKLVQEGLQSSTVFRNLYILKEDWEKLRELKELDLNSALANYGNPEALFEDKTVRIFNPSTPLQVAKWLIFWAAVCSAKLNYALNVGTARGFIPLADAKPFGALLNRKYARAVDVARRAGQRIRLTDLSFSVFDHLVPADLLDKLGIEEVIHYRKASESAREAFLEHLVVLQTKQGSVGPDEDYATVIEDLVTTEILPAKREFENRLQKIFGDMFGSLIQRTVIGAGSAGFVDLFLDLSWQKILVLAGGVGAAMATAGLNAILADRAAERECSISYLLSLEEKA